MNPFWKATLATLALVLFDYAAVMICIAMLNQADTALNLGAGAIGFLLLALNIWLLPKAFKLWGGAFKAYGDRWKTGGTPALLLAAIGLASITNTGCTRIDPGYVGIVVDMAGSQRGVHDFPVTTGWVWYNPWGTSVEKYPTFMQNAVWCKDEKEGKPKNEELVFNSKEGMVVAVDINLSYQLEAAKVPAFYVQFRNDDLELFTHGYLRNIARDEFIQVAATLAVDEIYGAKKEFLVKTVKDHMNTKLLPIGVKIDQLGFTGTMRLPNAIIESINAKTAAIQNSIRVENELRQTEAEAKKNVAKAEGDAKAAVAAAEGAAKARIAWADGEAKARIRQAEGEADANLKIAASITPNILEWQRLSLQGQYYAKWNGAVSMVQAGNGAGLLLQVPPPAAAH